MRFMSFCVLSNLFFFLNKNVPNQNDVYVHVKINLASKVNIRVTFSMKLGLVSFYTGVEFPAEFLTKAVAVLRQKNMRNF
jgi:hypothetical protein